MERGAVPPTDLDAAGATVRRTTDPTMPRTRRPTSRAPMQVQRRGVAGSREPREGTLVPSDQGRMRAFSKWLEGT
jgi:hypothetical protein